MEQEVFEAYSKIDSLVKKLLVNLELRWKMFKFRVINQHFAVAINVFVDIGGVWENSPWIGFRDLHLAKGSGFRLIWNENFVIALGVGNSVIKYDKQDSKETGAYLGLGHLY